MQFSFFTAFLLNNFIKLRCHRRTNHTPNFCAMRLKQRDELKVRGGVFSISLNFSSLYTPREGSNRIKAPNRIKATNRFKATNRICSSRQEKIEWNQRSNSYTLCTTLLTTHTKTCTTNTKSCLHKPEDECISNGWKNYFKKQTNKKTKPAIRNINVYNWISI